MKKAAISLLTLLVLLNIIYWLGPTPEYARVDASIAALDVPLFQLDSVIADAERKFSNIKPENESRIIWADSVRKTPYAMVYLHGFSAGVMESDPVHVRLAKKYGCNLYLARLSQHGLSGTESFKDLTPASLVNTAKEAVAIGQLIGEKVILVSCSTGGTLSIYLTANNPDLVAAQILYSPNTAIDDPTAKLLNMPWGAQLTKSVVGPYKEGAAKWYGTKVETYWTLKYRSEALMALQDLLDQTMQDEVFRKISSPYFIGYYYKNEEESDHVISIPALLDFDSKTSTPKDQKKVIAFADVGNHVMASDLQSKDVESVIDETSVFLEEVLMLQPIVEDSLYAE
ncbi:MAG: alpha/beta hydrolase [Reichenbachiella sp.]|uniref:alpha/beta hydrolase n=1 Tax=Reichenbachiella sp. TaxID=2184521 RepID=UPI00326623B6